MTSFFPEEKIQSQLVRRGIRDADVLEAMREIPREEFVTPESRSLAYEDQPIPIGHGQTISQPYIVALMTELAGIGAADRVLEVGTGCGYQTAILAKLAKEVYSVEILPELSSRAKGTLDSLELKNVRLRVGDGWEGWPEKAPFAAILVAAAPATVPPRLVEQLAEGGRLIIPVGEENQRLKVLIKKDGKVMETESIPVRFVPLVTR